MVSKSDDELCIKAYSTTQPVGAIKAKYPTVPFDTRPNRQTRNGTRLPPFRVSRLSYCVHFVLLEERGIATHFCGSTSSYKRIKPTCSNHCNHCLIFEKSRVTLCGKNGTAPTRFYIKQLGDLALFNRLVV